MSAAESITNASDLPRRVLFLNDVSFQYGAGIAQARQVEAILRLGIETGVLAWAPGEIELEAVATRGIDRNLWLGIRAVDHLVGGRNLSDDAVIAGLLAEVARFNPDVVIVGNLHAACWPFQLLPAIRRLGCRVITFLHDAYLYTGRCAYPGDCKAYLTGCTEACPTAEQYPRLNPSLIPGAWHTRREIFGGPRGIDVVANSQWNRRMFLTAMPSAHGVDTVELGADKDVFCPGDPTLARQQLGLPDNKPIVLCAAVNFQEARKGGTHLRAIVEALKDEAVFAAFGHNATEIPGLISLGYHLRADQLARCYQAADIFLGTATEEAFGQTVMEAQLCGVPAVAFHAGGVSEIIRHGLTGFLTRNADVQAAVAALRDLLTNPVRRSEFAHRAREFAAARFSQEAHALRWRDYLGGKPACHVGPDTPVLSYPVAESGEPTEPKRCRPSWPSKGDLIAPEQATIVDATAGLPGTSDAAELTKLFELGYRAGDIILGIGPDVGRGIVAAIQGALANPNRTLPPVCYALGLNHENPDLMRGLFDRTGLGIHSHVIVQDLGDFITRWEPRPTMVWIGPSPKPVTADDLNALSAWLAPGTPVLIGGYLTTNAVEAAPHRLAVDEWCDTGSAKLMGCFDCSVLCVSQK
ncbi:MAG: glycosyltransferase [Cephaloticoccus sp.]|nr:glycosyltransferase [Cephaloticoccus sp.]